MKHAFGRWVAIFILTISVLFSLGSHVNAELHSQSEIVSNVKTASLKIQEQKVFNKKQTLNLINTNQNKPSPPSQWEEVELFLISFRIWYLPRVYQSTYLSFASGRDIYYQKEREETFYVWYRWNLLL